MLNKKNIQVVVVVVLMYSKYLITQNIFDKNQKFTLEMGGEDGVKTKFDFGAGTKFIRPSTANSCKPPK